jgi:hypothetical protein
MRGEQPQAAESQQAESGQQQFVPSQQHPEAGYPAAADYRQPAGQQSASQQPDEREGFAHRLVSSPVAGFVPWILFWVIGGPSTWETASIAALLAAALLAVLSMEQPDPWAPPGPGGRPAGPRFELRRIKLLDAGTLVFFAALVIVALVTSRSDLAQLDNYSQPLSSGALGLIALGSIIFGHPFTVDYAREQAPPRLWHTAAFKKINLVLTAVWAGVFVICAILGLLAVHASTKGTRDWLNWYLPIILIFLGMRLNRWYPQKVRAKAQQSSSYQS